MREIKFKRYHLDYSGKLINISYWGFEIEEGYGFTSPAWVTDEERGKAKDCQYTGLKDKNGKEIYEGDILKYTYHRDRSGKDIAEFTDAIEWDGVNDSWSGFYVNKKMQHEVIGNIYEHPHLLSNDKDVKASVATEVDSSKTDD